jgi:predicted permease
MRDVALSWAWRGFRSRGWRGVFIIAILAIAMGADAVVFSSADSFVFHRLPYPDADRWVELGQQTPSAYSAAVYPELVAHWRRQTDLFSSFFGYRDRYVFVAHAAEPGFIPGVAVAPGLLDAVGGRPLVGRTFTDADIASGAPAVMIVSEQFAASTFGSVRGAINQRLPVPQPGGARDATVDATIVGVMPTAFRFPSGLYQLWLPFDVNTVGTRELISSIAHIAPGQSVDAVNRAVGDRAVALDRFRRPENQGAWKYRQEARPIAAATVDPRLKQLFVLLLGAAGCLLLVACLNVANIEMSVALARRRTQAVALALGASRASLFAGVILEGALIVVIAAVLATGLAMEATSFIAGHLPAATTTPLPNQVDVDPRTLLFVAGVAAVAWLLASLPVAFLASRADILDALRADTRTSAASRGGTRVRHALTLAETALTVVLLAGALFTARSYGALLDIPKGFDSSGLVFLSLRQPPRPADTDAVVQARILDALRARPDVASVAIADSAPPTMGGYGRGNLWIAGEPTPREVVSLTSSDVDLEFFHTLRLDIVDGRGFTADDPDNAVIVDEAFAHRFWPDGSAVGHEYDLGGAVAHAGRRSLIVGVARHLRTDRDSVTQPSPTFFATYQRTKASDKYQPTSFVARLNDPAAADNLAVMARTLAPGDRVRVRTVDDLYAATFADELLAASIMNAFGILALVVAAAGVYGVMTFLVAARTREIGIRMALGADRAAVNRLVLLQALRPVAAGTVVGVAAALLASRAAQSLLFGARVHSPMAYLGIAAVVLAMAIVATWQPASTAARVDPSRLLRD